MPEKEDSTEKKECCSGGCNSNSSSRSNSCVCSQNNSNSSNSGNNVEFLKERCGSLFTCFDGEPQRMQGFSAFESPPPRAVGSLGDSTLFGADSEAAAAAAAASAAAAAAAGAAAAAAAAATPGAGCSGEGSSDNTVPMSEKYRQQFEEVRHLLKSRCLFTEKTVDKHLLEYYNHLGLNEFYFRTAKPSSIADNLQAVIAARALHAVSGTEYFPEIQQIDERTGEVFALSKASLTAKRAAQNYKTERKLEQLFLNMGREENKQQMRMQCYRSTQSVFGIDANFERLRTYFFQKPDFPYREEELSPTEKDISKLLDVNFFASKKNTVTASIFQRLNEQLVGDSTGLALFVNVVPRGSGHRIDLAFRRGPHTEEFFSRFGDCLTMWGFYSQRKYVEPLANGSSIITTFVELLPEGILVFPSMPIQERIDNLLSAVRLQFVMAKSKYADFARDRLLTLHEAAYAMNASHFALHFSGSVGHSFPRIEEIVRQFGGKSLTMQEIYELRTRLKTCPFSEDLIFKVVGENANIVKELYKEFASLHCPRVKRVLFKETNELKERILRLESSEAVAILLKFREFTKSILCTNFYMPFKQGFAFRIRGSTLPSSDFPSTPCPIFFQIGGLAVGLHIRFAEVSRGGVRLVFSVGTAAHETNRRSLLDEAYKLAFTQQFKNKDISEGGSKGIILLNKTQTLAEAKRQAPLAFKAYIDNMLDLLLPHHDVDDGLGISEVWFLGPDENTGTGGLLDWAAQRAKERGSVWWKAFTTGKLIQHGGIPHDRFGMTTASVEAYVKGIYNKLGLKEEEMTRIQTGGPDGDLGCNALLQTKSKTIAVVDGSGVLYDPNDGSGVLYDPNGLDVGELHRLCSLRFEGKPTNAMLYDSSLLSPLGFKVDQEARDITLPDGVKVASGLEFRNFFHLSRYASADLFNPCGGRPASITPQNLDKLFDEVTGEKKFKFIVEGANVFITDDARRILEDRGVILFKDASTNKGGVTSSSLEVLAALALTEEEFNQHMQVKDPNNPPRFYKEYVKAILERIRENANLEFEAIWREAKRTGLRCCDLTDILSQKIIELKTDISKSNCLWADEGLVNYVLSSAVPDVLVPQLLSVEVFRKRVPEAYQQAIFTSFLSSRFFYGQPFTANVSAFAFIAYLEELKQKIQKQNPKP